MLNTIEKLRQYRAKGQFDSGHEYVCNLAQSVQEDKQVAIEVAQLYLVQGHFIRALAACEKARVPLFDEGLDEYSSEVLNEDSVCLELIHAFVNISRHSKLYTALRKASIAHKLWLGQEVEQEVMKLNIPSMSPIEIQSKIGKIIKQRDGLGALPSELGKEHRSTVSESRILMEYWYYKIFTSCSEQGLTDEPQAETKKRASKRISDLYTYVVQNNRLREARYLLYHCVSLLEDNAKVPLMLGQFLECLEGTSFDVEKAQTHLDLAEWQIRYTFPASASTVEHQLQEAKRLFEKTDHTHGGLDVADLRLLLPRAYENLEELFRAKSENAAAYFSKSCYLKGLRCLLFAIPKAFEIGTLDNLVEQSIDLLHKIISHVGAELYTQLTFIDITSQSLLRAPEYGHALHSLESYIKSVPEEIGPRYHSYLYLSLRKVYSSLGNITEARECAKKALEISSCNRNSYIDQSDAALELATVEWDARVEHAPGSPEELRQIEKVIDLLQTWAEKDASHSYLYGERMKCHELGIIENYLFNFHHFEDAGNKAKQWFSRAQRGSQESGIPSYEDINGRVDELIAVRNFEEAIRLAKSGLEQWQSAPDPPRFHLAQGFFRVGTTLHLSAGHMITSGSVETSEDVLEYARILMEAMRYSYEALKAYRSTGGAKMTVTCTNHIWLAIQDIKQVSEDVGLKYLEAYLRELEITESFCDSIRRSLASTEKIRSLLVKRQLVSNDDQRKFYSLATQSCIQLMDPGSAWTWIQKGKARALSDLFGIRAFVPSSLLQAIHDDPVAHKLYQQEIKSTQSALHASPQAYIGATRKVMSDREAMKAVPVLAQLLAIREGAFDVSLETSFIQQSLNLSNIGGQKLKYVDWYFLPKSEGSTEAIAIFVRDLSGNTSIRQLTVTVSDVQEWIRKVFEPPEGAEPELKRKAGNRTLWELNGLLDGVDEYTDEGDLLVLSPCGILNSVPLHGLKVGGRVLIDRNLIIYSSSAAIFRQCQARAAASAHISTSPSGIKEAHSRNDFLAVYEESSSLAAEERTSIFTSVKNIAESFRGNIKLGQEVTKTAFMETCRDASWLFYHGHAIYDKQELLESGLVLSDHNLTISDIFDGAAMQNSPHVTVIACDSGTQQIAPGDEPLGVVPALLFAGATSVLGCIWPIESWAGRIFSEKFHAHLAAQMTNGNNEGGSHTVVNLAAALRDAVREMMDKKSVETRLPYFWASFVLHGCWFHASP
ncbi:uncharacterized protein BDR25DRAFT_18083 [Lindgomyces ingoldianus]|uniref:Uncharacterized protein n=1 Tax=Lindgomyces ingoldianus TaxID=673940 RepID=A0ACB6QYG1_9PLEO|nr:uncharacterized protein BDR25DRAFT_18083 [Lindgomyces ingoldianus]KAF2472074.1 hypothetical protein BDR25DRAFT_18083 [Lindgomyces ingoldianus]